MALKLTYDGPFAVDIPAVGALDIEPGDEFTVSSDVEALRLLEQPIFQPANDATRLALADHLAELARQAAEAEAETDPVQAVIDALNDVERARGEL